MITREKFDFIKDKYAYCASWAIWSDEDEKPKSNIGDLTILDPDSNKNGGMQVAIFINPI